ncbi:MAG: hypothetical protein DCF15_10940 [Phormidesmis priestleyi]|uniref:Uncharacterized protein n=1 Tax=Phormidesmis priestleyi TaxID=268141 RepID=A0A2W4XDY1_9CYAN|nr:MAG: hypothetical protein DCF15_10940 [Phormidesmis priestleyi]
MSQPDYPKIVLSFEYRGWKIELDQSEEDGQIIYAVWANDDKSSAVAVPYAASQKLAIRYAKQWVDRRLSA